MSGEQSDDVTPTNSPAASASASASPGPWLPNPEFIVCDEPCQRPGRVHSGPGHQPAARICRQQLGLTYLFIAHDLSVVKHISNRVAVMYLGKMVELASSVELHHHPVHPYTVSLLSAVPHAGSGQGARSSHRIVLQGDVPSPMNMPSGCAFRTRCRFATAAAAPEECPQMREIAPGHFAACHNYENV